MEKMASREIASAMTGEIVPDAPDGVERRTSRRVIALIRPGKLVVDGREYLCVVKDLSPGGVKLRLFHTLPPHGRLHVEFDNGEMREVRVLWQQGDLAGFAFSQEADVGALLAPPSGTPRRPPRIAVRFDAALSAGSLRTSVVVRDLSQRGACIECSGWLMIDELVRIESACMPTLHAKIRWRRPPHYGVVFEQTFRLDELARYCSEMAEGAAD